MVKQMLDIFGPSFGGGGGAPIGELPKPKRKKRKKTSAKSAQPIKKKRRG